MLANSVRLLSRRVPAVSSSLLRHSAGASASFGTAPKAGALGDLDFSNVKLSGTPSPWAVFDAWGAGNEIHTPLADEGKMTELFIRFGERHALLLPLGTCSTSTVFGVLFHRRRRRHCPPNPHLTSSPPLSPPTPSHPATPHIHLPNRRHDEAFRGERPHPDGQL